MKFATSIKTHSVKRTLWLYRFTKIVNLLIQWISSHSTTKLSHKIFDNLCNAGNGGSNRSESFPSKIGLIEKHKSRPLLSSKIEQQFCKPSKMTCKVVKFYQIWSHWFYKALVLPRAFWFVRTSVDGIIYFAVPNGLTNFLVGLIKI